MTKQEVLDRDFLRIRWLILELAASLDRLDRAQGTQDGDPRLEQLRKAVKCLTEESERRAERVQLVFSREYDPDWRSKVM